MQQLHSPKSSPEWEQLRPLIDDMLHELSEADREAVLLRFFRGAPFADLARTLSITEGAARMRVERALERMNRRLAKRGIHSTAAAVGIALAAQPAMSAPTALAASITSCALSGASATGGALATFFAMGNLKLILAGAAIACGLTTAIIEGRTYAALHTQLANLAFEDPAPLERRNAELRRAMNQLGNQNPDVAELNRLRARLDTLQARPATATDAAFHAPQYLGRATPEAAVETFAWAIDQGDLDLAASFISFKDDSPANREAFLANFSDAIRGRYRTVERIYAAALYGAVHGKAATPDPMAALQIASIENRGFDQVRINLLLRTEGGREVPGRFTYQRRTDGWAEKPAAMLSPEVITAIQQRLDPTTGNYIPAGQPKR